MNESRWPQVEDLFQRVMELPQESREQFLDGLTDVDLAQEVRRLIEKSSGADEIFEDLQWMEPLLEAPPDPRLGTTLGVWRIKKPLGAGGMGAVYLCERADQQFQMQAA